MSNTQRLFLFPLCIVIGFIAAFFLVFNIQQPLLEMHGFRQTQTAITSYWFTFNGFSFNYETPVVGYPWSIPFEFPIYQYIVSTISSILEINIDATGRSVSIIFFLLTVVTYRSIFSELRLPYEDKAIFTILILSSPIYLFWSRTFMIESAAIFFASVTILFFVKLMYSQFKLVNLAIFSVFLSLSLLQKITTAASIIILISALSFFYFLKKYSFKKEFLIEQSMLFLSILFPVIIAITWTIYTDQIKYQNKIGAYLTSDALQKWNFGTMEARMNIDNWITIVWERSFRQNIAGVFGLFLVIFGIFTLKGLKKNIFYILLFLYFSNVAIFFNLHKIHNYYQYSSIIYLYVCVALVLSAIYLRSAITGLILILIFVSLNLVSYWRTYYPSASKIFYADQHSVLLTSDLIKQNTAPNTSIVIYGADWSSEIPYYSERKSLTVPKWGGLYDSAWDNPTEMLGNNQISSIVFCNFNNDDSLQIILSHPYVSKNPTIYKAGTCFLWFSDSTQIKLNNENYAPIELMPAIKASGDLISKKFTSCKSSIDIINKMHPPKGTILSISGIVDIKGWAIHKDKLDPDEKGYIVLMDTAKELTTISAQRAARNDVAKYFKNANLINSGIEGYINTIDMKNSIYSVYLAIEKDNFLWICTSSKKLISVEN